MKEVWFSEGPPSYLQSSGATAENWAAEIRKKFTCELVVMPREDVTTPAFRIVLQGHRDTVGLGCLGTCVVHIVMSL